MNRRSNASRIRADTIVIGAGPAGLGAALALILYPSFSLRNVSFVVFALFLSVSMSVTAFPVLARILTDLGIQKSRLGVLALACAAVDDVSAWCLLALVVSVIRAHPDRVLLTVALTAAFNLVVLLAVRRGALPPSPSPRSS